MDRHSLRSRILTACCVALCLVSALSAARYEVARRETARWQARAHALEARNAELEAHWNEAVALLRARFGRFTPIRSERHPYAKERQDEVHLSRLAAEYVRPLPAPDVARLERTQAPGLARPETLPSARATSLLQARMR